MAEVQWIYDRCAAGTDWLTEDVGTGWPAYARLFHPLDEDDYGGLRFSEIAAAHGQQLSPSSDWARISSPIGAPARHEPEPDGPMYGQLDEESFVDLCLVLRRHTSRPERCYFAIWEGWGGLHAASSTSLTAVSSGVADQELVNSRPAAAPRREPLDLSGLLFHTGMKNHHLFVGDLDDAVALGDRFGNFISPSVMWCDDRAWFMSTEPDFDSTYIAGSLDLVNELEASQSLEVLRVEPGMPFPGFTDG